MRARWSATADCLVALKQYEPALAELDRAIALDGAVDFQDFVFLMRRVQIQLLRGRSDLADAELDRIAAMLPDDAETRKYVATRLASLASDLFALKRSADANRLLGRCQKLDPSRKSMEYTFPARTRLPIAALPPASRDWIAEHSRAEARTPGRAPAQRQGRAAGLARSCNRVATQRRWPSPSTARSCGAGRAAS